ncbi:hypothetical protein QF037_009970 [Streptomyces canus]|nr:hypothetical protein [Streptomyces canus]
MAERNVEFGKFGARDLKGSEAVAGQLDALAGYIATPATARRGLLTRPHYLTRTDHARAAARKAGRAVTVRAVHRAGNWSQAGPNQAERCPCGCCSPARAERARHAGADAALGVNCRNTK